MEALSGVNLSRFAPFIFIRYQKRGRKPSRAALVFSHAGKGIKMKLYVVYELIEKNWQRVITYDTYLQAYEHIERARYWEKNWQIRGLEYAPKPRPYKIVRFEENQSFEFIE